jgi:ADP-heptose:LPS heptosyltransferase
MIASYNDYIYSQQLGFRCGASEEGEGVYTEYMTEADAARNNTENSSAKSIVSRTRALKKARIMIAKTTHVGDVVISLPLAGVLKHYFPEATILFLAKGQNCDIARRYAFIDEVYDESLIDTEEGLKSCRADVFIQVNNSERLAFAAKKADIPVRIGTIFRKYNWSLCTDRVFISREVKWLNRRDLDLEFLRPLGISHRFSYQDLSSLYKFHEKPLSDQYQKILDPNKFKLILHPTLITAKNYQWPLDYYKALIQSLDPEKFQIFITGVQSDLSYMESFLQEMNPRIVNLVGKINMEDLITVIAHCDGLVAGSTGPLHLAAALGIHALGIYRADKKYIRRWESVGWKAEVLAQSTSCPKCPNGDPCKCIYAIKPEYVKARILDWFEAFNYQL